MMIITKDDDDNDAHSAAAEIMSRVQLRVQSLHAKGEHDAAERLTEAAERADLDADTWGEAYLRLSALLTDPKEKSS